MPDPASCGRLRQRPVEIGGSVYLPIALPQRIEELFRIILEMAAEIRDPFEQSFFLMVHVPYLQPNAINLSLTGSACSSDGSPGVSRVSCCAGMSGPV